MLASAFALVMSSCAMAPTDRPPLVAHAGGPTAARDKYVERVLAIDRRPTGVQ